MGIYGIRDNKFKAKNLEAQYVEVEKSDDSKAVAYIKLESVSVAGGNAYLYLGTNGILALSSTAPTGTTGAFSNTGTVVAKSK